MLSKFSIRRPVTTIMLILMVFLGGTVAYRSLDLALMPDVNLPIAAVQTTYVGAGPSEVQTLISEPLEETLGTISNVENIYSVSSADYSIVMIQFVDGTDIDMAAVDMREAIDRMKSTLPEDASEPTVIKMDMNAIPIQIGVTAENMDLLALNETVEEDILPRLERIEGVAAVNASGGIEKEIRITVDPDRLQAYGLSVSSLSGILAAENMNLPSGSVDVGNLSIQVRTVGEFASVDEIKLLPITTGTGALIHLYDIAEVEEVELDKESFSLIDGKEGIIISADKQSTANLVDVSNRLQKELDSLSENYPELHLYMLTDSSSYIKQSISSITETAFLSAFLAFFVLLVFLKDPFTSFIVAVSIPSSIMATFALMYLTGLTLNIISMGGVTIGIGMLVDNSIVVLESIYQHYEKGYSPKEAAAGGAKEVAMAVTASTLTTVAVFLPMAFIGGTVGEMMKSLSYTICFALASSLAVSLTFVPMACALLLGKKRRTFLKPSGLPKKALLRWDRLLDRVNLGYGKLIRGALAHKKRTIFIVLLTFIGSLCTVPITGMDFMESMDEGVVSITIETPAGTDLARTEEVVREVLYRIDGLPEAEMIYANVGGGSMMSTSTSSSVTINLVDKQQRERSTEEIGKALQEELGSIPGTEITVSSADSASSMLSGSDVSLNLYGYDMDTLMDAEDEVVALLSEVEGLSNVSGSTEDSVSEAQVIIDRSKAASYGINTATIASALSSAINGTTATSYKVGGSEIDVVIRYDDSQTKYLTDLSSLMVSTATGGRIPLSEVASIELHDTATAINRENQKNYVTVSADAEGLSGSAAQELVLQALQGYTFPEDVTYAFSGMLEQMNEGFESLYTALIVAILLVYMIMASQFESLLSPAIVMFSMPLAITGAVLGLFITGNTITMASFMGFIMLVGMVVNNAIVLVDYINQLKARGMDTYQAITTAGPSRLRPILMTTLTTILGLLPMAFSNSEGSEMMHGLSIGVIFGLMLSTMVTLVFIPVLYAIADEKRTKRKEKRAAKRAKKAQLNYN